MRYNNANVQQRFGNNNLKAGAADRMDFRGRDGQQVLVPDRIVPAAIGRDRAGDRAGDRGGDRAGDRGGDRAAIGGIVPSKAAATAPRRRIASSAAIARQGRAKQRPAQAATAAAAAAAAAASNVSSGRAASCCVRAWPGEHASCRRWRRCPRGGGAICGGGGGFRGGGGGGGCRGGGGGGRRSDIALKHDVVLLGHLDNGLGYYRFSYLGSDKAYVGVIAQEVQALMPDAVTRGRDGYLRVYYEKLGIKFRTYGDWLAGGAQVPATSG